MLYVAHFPTCAYKCTIEPFSIVDSTPFVSFVIQPLGWRLTSELIPEMKVLFPFVVEASCSHTYIVNTETAKPDTVMLVYLKSKTKVKEVERKKITEWLSARVEVKNIKLLIE